MTNVSNASGKEESQQMLHVTVQIQDIKPQLDSVTTYIAYLQAVLKIITAANEVNQNESN